MTSNREALALWRLGLRLVEAKGVRSENRDGVATLICRTDTLTIAFTPSKDERPNGLDVWRRHGDGTGRKVLDVIWTDQLDQDPLAGIGDLPQVLELKLRGRWAPRRACSSFRSSTTRLMRVISVLLFTRSSLKCAAIR
jgi:hypothetical protein